MHTVSALVLVEEDFRPGGQLKKEVQDAMDMTELVVFGRDIVKNRMGGITRRISSANVPSDLSLLAFGIPPARKAESAGGMPKVPKGQGLGRLAR